MGLWFLLIMVVHETRQGACVRSEGCCPAGGHQRLLSRGEEPPNIRGSCIVAKCQFLSLSVLGRKTRIPKTTGSTCIVSKKKKKLPLRVNLGNFTGIREVKPTFKMHFSFLCRESTLPLLALLIILVMLAKASSISVIWH